MKQQLAMEPQRGPTLDAPGPQVLIAQRDVQLRLGGVSRVSVWRWMSEQQFPRPVRIGSRSLWSAQEVDQWIARRLDGR